MPLRLFLERRHAHQARNFHSKFAPAKIDELVRVLRRNAGFLRFLPRVYLNKELYLAVLFFDLIGNYACQLRPVHCMNGVEQRNGLCSFVALQRPHQM